MPTLKSKEEELLLFKRNQSSWVRRQEEVHTRIKERKGVAKGKFVRREDQDSLGPSKYQQHTWIYRPSREYQSSSLETIELAAGEGELQLRMKKNKKNCLRARLVGDEQVRIASTKIDGIGPKKPFSLIRYVTETKQFCSVSLFFLDSEDEPAGPNIIYEEPDDEASSSYKDVYNATLPARKTFSIVIFLASSVRRVKREMLSISQKQISPPLLPRSFYQGIERKDPGPEQVGLGYRAVSAVGGDRGRASQMVPYEVSIGLILIVYHVSAFGSAKAISQISPNPTQERTEGNRSMGNVRVSSQGSFFIMGHKAGSFI
ncbi:hypothetical protein FXO38_03706 [Capsicum annuum]|nr:hypothetical protein FXO38_03706 [Capsicum annuum]KAF3679955.1 hypothetical protein FXO37_03575 [Capsicum annuum]